MVSSLPSLDIGYLGKVGNGVAEPTTLCYNRRMTQEEWENLGQIDRWVGNTQPALTEEDFYRDEPNPRESFEAYMRGWNRKERNVPSNSPTVS